MDGAQNLPPQPEIRAVWIDYDCSDGNQLVRIENQNYMLSGDGYLMPTRKGQSAAGFEIFPASVVCCRGKSLCRSAGVSPAA